jgi:glycerate-2-kinase/glycosidase
LIKHHTFKNTEKFMSLSKLRQDALTIFNAGLKAADPKVAVHKYMQQDRQNLIVDGKNYNLDEFDKIYVVGGGKAGASMAAAVEEILGDQISEGIINVKYGHTEELSKVKINEADHPVPDEAGLKGAQDIIELLQRAGEKDLVIGLISGGGSALLPLPADGISLNEKQEVTRKLLACGATINEMNAVRKHISKIKGGQLAKYAYPATLVTLMLSDVIGNYLDVIASGPTVPDTSTFQDVKEILVRYKIWYEIPQSVKNHIERGLKGHISETPKADDEIFVKTQNVIVGSNIQAVLAASEKAKHLGYQTLVLSSFIEGETKDVARVHAAIAKEILHTANPIQAPACVISGGETTVTLRGHGKGGRNQEFVLAAALDIAGLDSVVILSGGTDGTDGPTDAAGALCDGETVHKALSKGMKAMDYLYDNNAYPFFKKLDDLLITGPTNTNVMDLRLILVGRKYMQQKNKVTMEFHISRAVRELYQFDETLFSLSGNVILINFHAARVFAQKMNEKRDLVNYPEQVVKSGHINAMGLIDEILHYVMALFREQKNSEVMVQALEWLYERIGKEAVDLTLRNFVDQFPPIAVYRGEIDPETYLQAETEGVPHNLIVLEEMLMLWLANSNPAFSPFLELFDDTDLEKQTSYQRVMSALNEFFDSQPTFGPNNQHLVDMLRSPATAAPHSLTSQLEYIREKWGYMLGKYLYRLLSSLDLIKEEEKMAFLGPGPAKVYDFAGLGLETERFSPDLDWMPRVVMIAKNTYVWLDQLSRKYQRPIHRLDQVPDEELDTLAHWGFTALWLIGLWERSKASQKIKQLCGNPEAVSSAYSLFDYQIAGDLGGDEAFQNLKERAWKRGIRMAGDMVPNHVGIDSKWVVQHPDWFISLDYSPFPSYSFSGPNLSWDERVGIYVEDHYYDRTDAAVVFKRVDHWTGSEKYIYHGNDGTSMPWNDTAQLNFLNPEAREAVIQTILHVARNFQIIRFDAAMTLTKKHYQRLWYPEPGTGGAIPTRAEHGLTRQQFDSLMPIEFWREVVDRVAQEVPDTLLLAEAFWLLEGYFVRTLGMHRVYNSAFMNMLKNEENANYRSVMKNTLEFNPEILKRFVNFMNNPDEETAVAQFGKDDKYFGACTMMVTLPGLPMFGHGQIEGFTEKYGMEYRRAYWDEQPDYFLIQRHEREIFPLLSRRYLFAEVENFILYDFFSPEGYVNEDVFAYSNRYGNERTLVMYHNKYAEARGWIRTSVGHSVRSGSGDERKILQKTLGQSLALTANENYFCIFRDQVTGLEYIRNSQELCDKGLFVELGAYKYHVFLDFREVQDNEWHQYAHLTAYLDGRGVPNMEEALREVFLQPIHLSFKELLNANIFRRLVDARVTKPKEKLDEGLIKEVEQKTHRLLQEIKKFTNGTGNENVLTQEILHKLEALLQLPVVENRLPLPKSRKYKAAIKYLKENLTDDPSIWTTLLGWLFVHALGKIIHDTEFEGQSRSWIDEWLLGKIIAGALHDFGLEQSAAWQQVRVIKLLTEYQRWFEIQGTQKTRPYQVLESLLKNPEVQQFLQVNRYQEILWFNKEAFEQLLWWLFLLAVVHLSADSQLQKSEIVEAIIKHYGIIQKLQSAIQKSNYQVEKLLELVSP